MKAPGLAVISLVNFIKKILELKIKSKNVNYHYMVVSLGFSTFSALKNSGCNYLPEKVHVQLSVFTIRLGYRCFTQWRATLDIHQ